MATRIRRALRRGTVLVAIAATSAGSDAEAATRGFVALAVPPVNSMQASQAAIDLNGDGAIDNRFGQVFATLFGAGLEVDFAGPVLAGEVVYLLRVTSSDPAFQTDPSARAEWIVGQPTAPVPTDFSGNGSFQIDGNYAPGAFTAPLAAANFLSANPVTTTAPVDVPLQFFLADPFVLGLRGARLTFTVIPGGMTLGQLNGSISQDDVQAILIPALATYFNQIVAAGGPDAMTLLALFDDGCAGVGANDGMISACEVSDSVVGTLLTPDVDIYADDGSYAPNPANTSPDSLSFGMKFTAANAQVPLEVVFADSFE